MRLMNQRADDGTLRCLAISGTRGADITHSLDSPDPISVGQFLERPDWRSFASALIEERGTEADELTNGIQLGPVVDKPRNVVVVGANTHSHLKEASTFTQGIPPQRPMVLAKSPNAINGPYDEIEYPPETVSLDYEAEMAVVIGRTARRIGTEYVHEFVAGFTVVNDVSARDYQLSDWEGNTFYRTHYLGKSFEGFCPCGPVIATPDELGNFGETYIRAWVNQELRQEETLDDLYFSVEQLVSYVSQFFTLWPGDILLTGSPAGVGAFHPAGFLKPGDVVRCEVDGIGAIENRIVSR